MTTIDDLRHNFEFARGCAALAGIPHTDGWTLISDNEKVFPWRVVDNTADAAPDKTIVFVLTSRDPRYELEAIGRAFRAVHELATTGFAADFTCPARKNPSLARHEPSPGGEVT